MSTPPGMPPSSSASEEPAEMKSTPKLSDDDGDQGSMAAAPTLVAMEISIQGVDVNNEVSETAVLISGPAINEKPPVAKAAGSSAAPPRRRNTVGTHT